MDTKQLSLFLNIIGLVLGLIWFGAWVLIPFLLLAIHSGE